MLINESNSTRENVYNHQTFMSDKELHPGTERLNKIVSINEQGRQRLGMTRILIHHQSQVS